MKKFIERNPKRRPFQDKKIIRSLEELQSYYNQDMQEFLLGNLDVSHLDFSSAQGQLILAQSEYDTDMIFSETIHSQMIEQLEKAKNPGLGVRTAHKAGYTGKHVTIAIVDQPLDVEHEAYKKSLKHYKQIGWGENNNQPVWYHGPAVTSITSSVAPEANIIYIATHNHGPMPKSSKGHNDTHQCEALQYLLDLNSTLSDQDKIRFLSCSWGTSDDLNYEKRNQLFQELENQGVMIFGGYRGVLHNQHIVGLSRDLTKSLDDPANYHVDFFKKNAIAVPEHNISFASSNGGYVYASHGGSSWTYPYLAGVGACALQANPDFVKQEGWQSKLWQLMFETGFPLSKDNSCHIIQPARLCERMNEMYLQQHRTNTKTRGKGSR